MADQTTNEPEPAGGDPAGTAAAENARRVAPAETSGGADGNVRQAAPAGPDGPGVLDGSWGPGGPGGPSAPEGPGGSGDSGRPAAPDGGDSPAAPGGHGGPAAPGQGGDEPEQAEVPTDDGEDPAGEAARYRDLAMRKQAEFENYRKRMARENAQAAERGASQLAKALLPAFDKLELSISGAEGHADADVIRGFALVRDELLAAFDKAGIEAFSPLGERFDPNEHEAMVQQPAEGAESGTIIEVYQQGYRSAGQVLRPARVVVAK